MARPQVNAPLIAPRWIAPCMGGCLTISYFKGQGVSHDLGFGTLFLTWAIITFLVAQPIIILYATASVIRLSDFVALWQLVVGLPNRVRRHRWVVEDRRRRRVELQHRRQVRIFEAMSSATLS